MNFKIGFDSLVIKYHYCKDFENYLVPYSNPSTRNGDFSCCAINSVFYCRFKVLPCGFREFFYLLV